MSRFVLIISALLLGSVHAEDAPQKALHAQLVEKDFEKLLGLSEIEKKFALFLLAGDGNVPTVRNFDRAPSTGFFQIPDARIAVDQVVDARNFIGRDQSLWVTAGTANLTDNSVVQIGVLDVFYSHGAKSYSTVLGANRTIKHVEVVDTTNPLTQLIEIIKPYDYHFVTIETGRGRYKRTVRKLVKLIDKSGINVEVQDHLGDTLRIKVSDLDPKSRERLLGIE